MVHVDVIEKFNLTGRGLTFLVNADRIKEHINKGDYITDGQEIYRVKSFIFPTKPSAIQYVSLVVDIVSVEENVFDK